MDGKFLISKFIMQIKFKIVNACITLMLVVCVMAWLYKIFGFQDKARVYESYTAPAGSTVGNNVSNKSAFAEEEEKREAALESQRHEKEFTKAKLKQEMSNECQFWKLQKKMGKSPVANAKINQYCYLNAKSSHK